MLNLRIGGAFRRLLPSLTEDDVRSVIAFAENETGSSGSQRKGGILTTLRRSPLVGADVTSDRPLD